LLIGGYLWSSYNQLVSLSESIDNRWAQVETQYQRRLDLIPNLVESVKGIMAQEQRIFSELAEARSQYAGASGANKKAQAATQIEGALSRLIAIMENYPQLKSSENVGTLMIQLEGTENRISVERKRYNDAVQSFNVVIKRFPTNLIAKQFNYSEKNYFTAEAGSENAPQVDLEN